MIAEDLINHMIPPLKGSDDAHKAIVWMEEFRCTYLPVVDNNRLLGFISEEIILETNDIEKHVGDFNLAGLSCYVHLDTHFYDILKVATDNKLQMVAVLNDDQQYAGVITVQDTLTSFAQTAAVQMPGAILVLSMNYVDYSLSEISRLIEENHAKILSSIIKEDPLDPGKIRLTLKINQTDMTRIVATLERFNYKVIGRYQESRPVENERERIDMLLRYLDI
ncbi:CBS domain-containing protein [Chryseosolibacter indicus]|uniref:CBS domain-containing protein n=1 Tax=Chryseosolibacter indicus TaxID=2782351 RepID=A0ABS5VX65_9BACT|nr:CBS domain-containing protein [Chryseosolibacter indicus]MBT1706005.1 CBS domain-containing protein [Chryseosolibacter indicus]